MPVDKWLITPTRLILPTSFGGQNGYKGTELTDSTNATMSSIILQLSCLAECTEMMFGEIIQDAYQLANRTNQLTGRVSLLKEYVSQLNPTVEEGLFISTFFTFLLSSQ